MNNNKNKKSKFITLGNPSIYNHDESINNSMLGKFETKGREEICPNNMGQWRYVVEGQLGDIVPSGTYIFWITTGDYYTNQNGQVAQVGSDGYIQWVANPTPKQTTSSTPGPSPTPTPISTNPNNSGGSGSSSNLQNEINSLNQALDNLKNAVSTNQGDISTNTNDIKTLNNDVSTLKTAVSTDNTTISNDTSQIAKDEATIATDKMQLDMDSAQMQEEGNSNNTGLLNSNITTLQNQVNSAQSTVQSQAEQIKQLQQQIQQLQTENQALSNQDSKRGNIVVDGPNASVDTMTTILTLPIFKKFTTNYYLGGNTTNSYYTGATVKRLPSIIANVEMNLNAMLNGRLYERYTPGAVVFHGYGNLTPQVEEQTLYQCLTECVEYRLITQQYVNLTNSYSGTVNGANNYQTQNNNVIGLRQDIQAKLSILGLYANVLIGKKVPKSTEYQTEHDGFNTINFSNLQQWYGFIQNTAWNFTKPISFQGGMSFSGDVNFTNSVNVPSLTSKTGVFSNSLQTSLLNVNTIQGNDINLYIPGSTSITYFHADNEQYSGTNPITNTPWNAYGRVIIGTGIVPQLNKKTNALPSLSDPLDLNAQIWGEAYNVHLEGASTMDLIGAYGLNLSSPSGSITISGPTTFTDKITFNQAPNFSGDLNVNGNANVSGNLTALNGTFTNSLQSPNINTTYLNVSDSFGVGNANQVGHITGYQIQNNYQGMPIITTLNSIASLIPSANNGIATTTIGTLINNVGEPQITALLPGNNFNSVIVSQTVYDVYDMSNLTSIPGYMTPLVDNVSYLNLQTLFLNTFGNGDLTNGYSYSFNVSPTSLGFSSNSIPLSLVYDAGWTVNPISVQLVDCAFTVAITTSDYDLPAHGDFILPPGFVAGNANTPLPAHIILQQITTNPFPSGALLINNTVPNNSTTGQTLNSFRFTLTVPSAIDNRKPDDTMFLHGAMTIPTGALQLTPSYLVCQLTIVYSLTIPLAFNPMQATLTPGSSNPNNPATIPNVVSVPTPTTNSSNGPTPPGMPAPYEPLYVTFAQQLTNMTQQIQSNVVSVNATQLNQFISIINQFNNLVKTNNYTGSQMDYLYNNVWKAWNNAINN